MDTDELTHPLLALGSAVNKCFVVVQLSGFDLFAVLMPTPFGSFSVWNILEILSSAKKFGMVGKRLRGTPGIKTSYACFSPFFS